MWASIAPRMSTQCLPQVWMDQMILRLSVRLVYSDTLFTCFISPVPGSTTNPCSQASDTASKTIGQQKIAVAWTSQPFGPET